MRECVPVLGHPLLRIARVICLIVLIACWPACIRADGSAALVFGLRDCMMTPITFAPTEFITDFAYTVCLYDYCGSGNIKDSLFDRLRGNRTEPPSVKRLTTTRCRYG